MKVAYDLLNVVIDIDDAYKGQEYLCIHCGCDMIPSALDSFKVSPYFRAKNSHEDDCAVKLIDTKTRYNNKDSELEEIYEKVISSIVSEKDKEPNVDSNPERKRKENSKIRIRFLNQLVSFCLGNDINESLGEKKIRDFFVDRRTYKSFAGFKENELYLVGARFKKYIDNLSTMYFTYPNGVSVNEVGLYFFDKNTFYKVREKVFNKDEKGNYKDIYVLAMGSSKGKLKVYNEGQFFFTVGSEKNIEGE